MRSYEIKNQWLEFFKSKNHKILPSASLISSDPTLLFTIAGMVPFIPYMINNEEPPFRRVTSVQKCIRTLDIEEVGITARHGTFFQMNGNFSFGDYFKKDAIAFAWELLTNKPKDGGFGLKPEKLWVTVYKEDKDAYKFWKNETNVQLKHVQQMSMKENFWSTGQIGPAGPCSEIFYDRGEQYGDNVGPSKNEDRYIEIWNLVFMQYKRGKNNGRHKNDFEILGDLSQKNIDTGLGLERLAFLLQNVNNIYEIDEIFPILKKASEISGIEYKYTEQSKDSPYSDTDVKLRIIADHVRSALMLIADGVTPSNDNHGYVLRRLIRRTVRSMHLLGITRSILPELLPVAMDVMSLSYPELKKDFKEIEKIAYKEEKVFLRTIASGNLLLDNSIKKAKIEKKPLSAEQVFILHDTHGFPFNLTMEAAHNAGLKVDEKGFELLMEKQKMRARKDAHIKKYGHMADTSIYEKYGNSKFKGYTTLKTNSKIQALLIDGEEVAYAKEGSEVNCILDETPFYAEAGGQSADQGIIVGKSFELEVSHVYKPIKNCIVHKAIVRKGILTLEENVEARVNPEWRLEAKQAHSGTHILHAALREVLGKNAVQAGSFNKPGYLRLDFKYDHSLDEEIKNQIEFIANKAIRNDLKVWDEYMSLAKAKEKGALALFNEKYDDFVRVVTIGGPWSIELCGGTHVEHSSQVGSLAIMNESSIGSDIHRIEAFVGLNAFKNLILERSIVRQISNLMKVKPLNLEKNIIHIMDKLKKTEKELENFHKEKDLQIAKQLSNNLSKIGTYEFILHNLGKIEEEVRVRNIMNQIANLASSKALIICILAEIKNNFLIFISATPGAQKNGLKANKLLYSIMKMYDIKGGGNDKMAQGKSKKIISIDEIYRRFQEEFYRQ